jgi:hypothetical protein
MKLGAIDEIAVIVTVIPGAKAVVFVPVSAIVVPVSGVAIVGSERGHGRHEPESYCNGVKEQSEDPAVPHSDTLPFAAVGETTEKEAAEVDLATHVPYGLRWPAGRSPPNNGLGLLLSGKAEPARYPAFGMKR